MAGFSSRTLRGGTSEHRPTRLHPELACLVRSARVEGSPTVTDMTKLRILVLCTGNSCRSQMAEGFFRHYGGERVEVFSAGLSPKGVHPLAIKVMAEIGIDISMQTSKHLNEYIGQKFDYLITVCDNAAAN